MAHCNVAARTIFCKDNLEILQGINTNCIDLIYLDPPFNKKKIFTAPLGSSAAGASFKDIFTQEDVKEEWVQTIAEDHDHIWHLLNAVKRIEGGSSYNFCYLAYMAIRLIECHRILNATGSIYLHCDPTMSHYLKILLDCIFGEKNLRNEIVWSYQGTGQPKNAFKRKHDIIFFYGKGKDTFFSDKGSSEKISSFSKTKFTKEDDKGRYKEIRHPDNSTHRQYLREYQRMRDVWEIPVINAMARERTKYPTQKPLALLERIIQASSHEGDMVLDPFCGCATTCVAAEKLKRQWIGIDTSHQAYELVKVRIEKEVYTEGLVKGDKGYLPDIHYFTDPPERTDGGVHTADQKYVYVISHPQYRGEYKVGIASDVKSRLNSYQTSDPNRAYKLEHSLLTEHYRALERHIHETFDNRHEWVRGNLQEIIDAIGTYQPKNAEELFN